MSAQLIANVIAKLPELTIDGIAPFPPANVLPAPSPSYHELRQAELLKDLSGFNAACAWLENQSKTDTLNLKHDSYGLKHALERATGLYVAHGTFIAAAIHMGFVCEQVPGTMSARFCMSGKFLG